jgi:hypothetical protein
MIDWSTRELGINWRITSQLHNFFMTPNNLVSIQNDWLTRELGTNWLTNKVTASRTSRLRSYHRLQWANLCAFLWKPKVKLRYYVHRTLILNKFTQIHIITICLFKSNLIVILLPRRLPISGFQSKIRRYFFLSALWVLHGRTTLFVLIHLIIIVGDYTLWSCLLCLLLRHFIFVFI